MIRQSTTTPSTRHRPVPPAVCECGAAFTRRAYNVTLCPKCAAEKRRVQKQTWYQNRGKADATEKLKTKPCARCGQMTPYRSSNRKYCPDCYKLKNNERTRVSKAKTRAAYRAVNPPKPIGRPKSSTLDEIPTGEYLPEKLDLLAAAVCGQAWRDMRCEWQDGEYIAPAERADARAWWYSDGQHIVGLLCPELDVPELER